MNRIMVTISAAAFFFMIAYPAISQGTTAKPVIVKTQADTVAASIDSLNKKILEMGEQIRVLKSEIENQKRMAADNLRLANERQQEIVRLKAESEKRKNEVDQLHAMADRQRNELTQQEVSMRRQMEIAKKQKEEAEIAKAEADKQRVDMQKQLEELKKNQPGNQ